MIQSYSGLELMSLPLEIIRLILRHYIDGELSIETTERSLDSLEDVQNHMALPLFSVCSLLRVEAKEISARGLNIRVCTHMELDALVRAFGAQNCALIGTLSMEVDETFIGNIETYTRESTLELLECFCKADLVVTFASHLFACCPTSCAIMIYHSSLALSFRQSVPPVVFIYSPCFAETSLAWAVMMEWATVFTGRRATFKVHLEGFGDTVVPIAESKTELNDEGPLDLDLTGLDALSPLLEPFMHGVNVMTVDDHQSFVDDTLMKLPGSAKVRLF